MFTIIVILVSLGCIFLSGYLFRLSAGSLSLSNLNMMTFIFWFDLIILSYLGSVVILLLQSAEFNELVDNITGGFETKLRVWIFVSYTIVAFPIGMWLSKLIWNFKVSEFGRYRTIPIRTLFSPGDSYVRYPLYFLSFLCLGAVVYTYWVIGYVPLLRSSRLASEAEVMQLRASIDLGFGGNVYFKNIFGLLVTPVLTYVSFAYYRLTKSRKDLLWFLIMLIATFFMETYDMSKSPFVRFLCGFLFFRILTGKIKASLVYRYAGIGLGLMAAFFIVFGKQSGLAGLLFSYNTGITGRVIISQISSLYRHLEIFPSYHPFIGFSSLSQVLPFGHPSERSARIVMEVVSPSWIEMDMGGVYNTLFIGEAYANFGLAGIILSPLWIGFLIQSLFVFLIRRKKSPLWLGLFVYFSYNSNITGGFNEYIYDAQVIILALIVGGIYAAAVYLIRSKEFNNGSTPAGSGAPGFI